MAKIDERTQRVLLLLKLDAQHLYERVQLRAPEYMLIFSSKRTKGHFKDIFWYRYDQATIAELKLLSTDLIIALDDFYTSVEKIKWNLYYTEDMPKTVEDWLYRQLALLEKKYFNLEMYINAEYELGQESPLESEDDDHDNVVDATVEEEEVEAYAEEDMPSHSEKELTFNLDEI